MSLYTLGEYTFARTRKSLLGALWERYEIAVDIFKEGPEYAFIVNGYICATGIRCIDSWSVETWAEEIKWRQSSL